VILCPVSSQANDGAAPTHTSAARIAARTMLLNIFYLTPESKQSILAKLIDRKKAVWFAGDRKNKPF